jgi:hypothetical protein
VRASPAKWTVPDGEVVVRAIQEAQRNPVSRPVDRRKLERQPTVLHTKIGAVTVPGIDEPFEKEDTSQEEATETSREPRLHTEIQWLLLKLGNDIGLDVWVANNDRSQGVNGHKFANLPRLKKELPLQFDVATTQIIKLIDPRVAQRGCSWRESAPGPLSFTPREKAVMRTASHRFLC